MAVKPRLKPEIRYYQTKKVSDYFTGADPGISKTAFVRALNGRVCEPWTMHRIFNLLEVPPDRREGLIEWVR
ncbi:MAG: hypothetical protein JW765_13350 [Deltaproteobacteria bacterium]|nr:hypothetical protein [Candidatus Zymogenaceae bacterium]